MNENARRILASACAASLITWALAIISGAAPSLPHASSFAIHDDVGKALRDSSLYSRADTDYIWSGTLAAGDSVSIVPLRSGKYIGVDFTMKFDHDVTLRRASPGGKCAGALPIPAGSPFTYVGHYDTTRIVNNLTSAAAIGLADNGANRGITW